VHLGKFPVVRRTLFCRRCRVNQGGLSLIQVKVKVKVKVKVTLLLRVYRQSVHLGVKPLETHDQSFFQLNPCCNSPHVTTSLTLRKDYYPKSSVDCDGLRCRDIHTKFHKDWLRHSKADRMGYTDIRAG
jgi:hypothetical protein